MKRVVVAMCWHLTLLVLCLVSSALDDDKNKKASDDGMNDETRKVVVARMNVVVRIWYIIGFWIVRFLERDKPSNVNRRL